MIRPLFMRRLRAIERLTADGEATQRRELHRLLRSGVATEYGSRYGFKTITTYDEFRRRVPLVRYEDIRSDVMRMVDGEKNVLWPGRVRNFAQSSGTSDGKSKYIPISRDSFNRCHYQGGFDTVALYLGENPKSRIFDGKAFILGGSFANELHSHATVGDLSANLIDNITPLANLVRIPSKRIALMEEWEAKLPALVGASRHANVTNLSGVPSWFLSVLKELLRVEGCDSLHQVWPNLEVFFHGGINFRPYSEQYRSITDPDKMHYVDTYNASEGFFAAQYTSASEAMLLLLDLGIFFEFIPFGDCEHDNPEAVPIEDVVAGRTYELVITSCNGLWRYRPGDTVRIESTSPLTITVAGRTKHYINAFGEELMVYNADEAVARTCEQTGDAILNYTAAPVYATRTTKGRHQWLIEFARPPHDVERFADLLDQNLQQINSDYQAKRTGGIFIDRLSIIVARQGLFDDWLMQHGGKLGGQRKIPRLLNNRDIIDSMIELNPHKNIEK